MGIKILQDALICPHCNSEYLHHLKVSVMFRDAEDKDGTEVLVSGEGANVKRLASKEIPGRRDYLEIGFWCETCDRKPILSIMQHKGSTLIEWRG